VLLDLFHIIAQGSCWIGDRLEVSEGDVVVLPHGEHVMGSAELVPPLPGSPRASSTHSMRLTAVVRAKLACRSGWQKLLFLEVLRLYTDDASPRLNGWLAAVHDPIVGLALAALHADATRKWTLDELAAVAACSRSTLNDRFGRQLGRAPMQYLNDRRLQIATGLLRDTTLGVAAIAYRIGYESEEAFKRSMGSPPAQWRQRASG
jgi:AraC-like DNA-binding protein